MKKTNETYAAVFKDYPDVVTVEQMSEMLGISTKSNTIKHFMVGRIYKIPKYHILVYLNLVDAQN